MKRSLSNSLSRIWKGFKFHLESPSVHWVKSVGGSKLGASIGVIVKNLLDIQISGVFGVRKWFDCQIVRCQQEHRSTTTSTIITTISTNTITNTTTINYTTNTITTTTTYAAITTPQPTGNFVHPTLP
ncbi:hypothetical protein LSAT2_019149, partial [Lamellibrachia satsuma]